MREIASGLHAPEGPVALDDGSVIVCEMAAGTVLRIRPDGKVQTVARIPGGPNGAAIGPDGRLYVCNNGGMNWIREAGTYRPHGQPENYTNGAVDVVDLVTGKVERLYEKVDGHWLKGPNDIVFDADGGFYFTDIGKRRPRDADRGFVYYALPDGSSIKEVAAGVTTPNGIGLSPARDTLYVAETDTGRLMAWDILAPGELRKNPWPAPYGGRCVCGPGGYTRFDSLAVAASGNVCVAAIEGSIVEIAPDGSWHRSHPVPDMLVTNLCFGGAGLRTAYVTLTHRGVLLEMAWHEPGLPLQFQGG
jgi:gluconolactonase